MAFIQTNCRICGKELMSSLAALSSANPVGIICGDCATPEQIHDANLAAGHAILVKAGN
jgi:transcription elongation factor Elf1